MGKIPLTKLTDVTPFRKIAMGSWSSVGDPSVYGLLEVDMTEALRYMKETEAKAGVKISPAHLVGKAVAQILQQRPEINGLIRFSHLYQRKTIDIFYQINVPGKDDKIKKATLSGAVLRSVEKMSVIEIAQTLRDKAEKVRSGEDKEISNTIKMMNLVPWLFMRWVLNISSFLNYTLNLDLSLFGIPKDPFGSVMITNIGSLGVDIAWAPLIPYTRVPLLLTLGAIQETPFVVDHKVEVRQVMKIGITFDHRFMDGVHAAAMSKHFKECFADPSRYLN
jgi:pyruvate/2-oxoglutarate dehydrogenase complex dihydrolipoamide acyltransferase (E2) component